jgi:hypothetical protein
MASSRLVRGDPKLMFRSPSSSGLHVEGQVAQAAQRSSTLVVSAGGMYALITKKSNSPRDQLEHQHIGGGNFHCLNLKVLMFCCPKQSNPPLLWTCRLQRDHVIPLDVLGVLGVSELGLS